MTCPRLLVGLVLLAAVSACRASQPGHPGPPASPLQGAVWSAADGAVIAEATLLDRLAVQPLVLLGEQHDHPEHHALQARVVDALVARGRRPALVFELFPAELGPALADALRAERPRLADVARAVRWQERSDIPWRDYAPPVSAGLRWGLPIVAADLPRSRLRALGQRGARALTPPVQARLTRVQLGTSARAALEQQLRDAHCGQLPDAALDGMVLAQQARDAALAHALVTAARDPDGAVLIAGAEHVRRDRGVPAYLDSPLAALAFVEVDPGVSDPQIALGDRAELFDYAWFTARRARPDPCERYRKALDRLR